MTLGMALAAPYTRAQVRPATPQKKLIVSARKGTAPKTKMPAIHKADAAYGTTLLTEDFSKFAKGSEARPDSLTNIYDDNGSGISAQYTSTPGWSANGIGQAGGCAYFVNGYDFYYLQTPVLDLTPNGGTGKVHFRAKAKDGSATVIVGNARENASDFNIYNTFHPDNEWKEYTAPYIKGSTRDVVQFQTENGVFIDDIRIVVEGVPAPEVLPCTQYNYTSVTANWKPVDGAEKYAVHLYRLNTDNYEYDLYKVFDDIHATTFHITGLDADVRYTYRVTATRDGEESAESDWAEIESALGEPVVLEATDFTGDSFTANWQPMEGAKAYKVTVYLPEEIDEDFYRYNEKKQYTVDAPASSCHVDGLDPDSTYYYTVAAQDEYGVWSEKSDFMRATVASLDTPVALAATGITAKGFTAHWQAVPFATAYRVQLYKTVYAADGDTPVNILDADFSSSVFSSGTVDMPDALFRSMPLTDYVDNAYGWSIPECGVLINGAVGLDNTMAEYFGDAYLTSPVLNLSHGSVDVTLTLCGKDVSKAVVCLAKKENGGWTTLDSKEMTVGNSMQSCTVTLAAGEDNTYIIIKTPDYGYLYLQGIKVDVNVKKGDHMDTPVSEKIANGGKTTSTTVSGLDLDNGTCYSYGVTATRIDGNYAVNSLTSNIVSVSMTSGIGGLNAETQPAAYAAAGMLHISNPAALPVTVCNAAGAAVFTDPAGAAACIALPARGLYLVKIGQTAIKVLNR